MSETADAGERLVWRYEVRLEAVDAFVDAYGEGGDWDAFFSGAPGYACTELYREVGKPNVYLTVDYWSKPGQRDAYVASRQAEYNALDARCAEFTIDEQRTDPGRNAQRRLVRSSRINLARARCVRTAPDAGQHDGCKRSKRLHLRIRRV